MSGKHVDNSTRLAIVDPVVGGVRRIWADEGAALFVAAAILWTGGRILVGSISKLLDPQADAEFVRYLHNC